MKPSATARQRKAARRRLSRFTNGRRRRALAQPAGPTEPAAPAEPHAPRTMREAQEAQWIEEQAGLL